MSSKVFLRAALVLILVLITVEPRYVMAANMRSFIEAVRHKATVVYVGSVKEVHLLTRTKFDIKARAVIEVLAVVRSPSGNPREATLDYSSFDEKTPILAGGPQYQFQPGDKIVVFTNSFVGTVPPGYIIQGSRGELLQRTIALRQSLNQMSADQLRLHEIDEGDRRIQLQLYDKLCAYLRSSK